MAMLTKCGKCGNYYDINKGHTCPNDSAKKMYQNNWLDGKSDEQKMLRTKRWHNVRQQVIAADGGECQRCLRAIGIHTFTDLQVHHIKPRSEFPELVYELDNLITLCGTCNRTLGTRDTLDFDWNPSMRMGKLDDTPNI